MSLLRSAIENRAGLVRKETAMRRMRQKISYFPDKFAAAVGSVRQDQRRGMVVNTAVAFQKGKFTFEVLVECSCRRFGACAASKCRTRENDGMRES